jgi:hypothetical protein
MSFKINNLAIALVSALVITYSFTGCKKHEPAPPAPRAKTAQPAVKQPARTAPAQKNAAAKKPLQQNQSKTALNLAKSPSKASAQTQAAKTASTTSKTRLNIPADQNQFRQALAKTRQQAASDANSRSNAKANAIRFQNARFHKPLLIYNASRKEIKTLVVFYNDQGFVLKNIPSCAGMEDVLLTNSPSVNIQLFITFADNKQFVVPTRKWNFTPDALSSIRIYNDGTADFR